MTHHDPFEDLAARSSPGRPGPASPAPCGPGSSTRSTSTTTDHPPSNSPRGRPPCREHTTSPPTTTSTTGRRPDGIWAPVTYTDARAGIRFLVDVLGFEEQMVVAAPDDESMIVHSQIRWPEGGLVQVNTDAADNPFLRASARRAVALRRHLRPAGGLGTVPGRRRRGPPSTGVHRTTTPTEWASRSETPRATSGASAPTPAAPDRPRRKIAADRVRLPIAYRSDFPCQPATGWVVARVSSPSAATSRVAVSPSSRWPSRMALATRSPTSRWMTRLSGRAPKAGS